MEVVKVSFNAQGVFFKDCSFVRMMMALFVLFVVIPFISAAPTSDGTSQTIDGHQQKQSDLPAFCSRYTAVERAAIAPCNPVVAKPKHRPDSCRMRQRTVHIATRFRQNNQKFACNGSASVNICRGKTFSQLNLQAVEMQPNQRSASFQDMILTRQPARCCSARQAEQKLVTVICSRGNEIIQRQVIVSSAVNCGFTTQ